MLNHQSLRVNYISDFLLLSTLYHITSAISLNQWKIYSTAVRRSCGKKITPRFKNTRLCVSLLNYIKPSLDKLKKINYLSKCVVIFFCPMTISIMLFSSSSPQVQCVLGPHWEWRNVMKSNEMYDKKGSDFMKKTL